MPNDSAPRLAILVLALCPACSAPAATPEHATDGAGEDSSSVSMDSSTASPSESSSDPSTTASEPTTASTTSTTEDAETTDVGESSTGDASDDSSSDASSDGSSGGDESSTDDGSSSGGESSSTGTPMDNDVDGFYGDCVNASEQEACNLGAGEACLHGPVGAAFCSVAQCDDADDCAPATGGDATVECGVLNDGITHCYMSCAQGEACPDGMSCIAEICAWLPVAPGGGVCPDEDVAGELPFEHTGTTIGLFDDVLPSCAPGGEEALLQFVAPQDGTYRFTTAGSAFDTILVVMDGCDGPQLACNDDGDGLDLQSSIEIALVAAQAVVVAVDGFGGDAGEFTLDIVLMP